MHVTCFKPMQLRTRYFLCQSVHLQFIPTNASYCLSHLSAKLEKLQKRATRIIFPFMPYKVALATAGLPSMYERRETITAKLFNDVISSPDHKLHSLLPTRNQSKYSLRNNRAYHIPGAKTNRFSEKHFYIQ